jgi:hypothetical protein
MVITNYDSNLWPTNFVLGRSERSFPRDYFKSVIVIRVAVIINMLIRHKLSVTLRWMTIGVSINEVFR